jgi:hypothetical protein
MRFESRKVKTKQKDQQQQPPQHLATNSSIPPPVLPLRDGRHDPNGRRHILPLSGRKQYHNDNDDIDDGSCMDLSLVRTHRRVLFSSRTTHCVGIIVLVQK